MEIFKKKSSWIERLYASNPEMISFYPIDITNFLFRKLARKTVQELPLDPFRLIKVLESVPIDRVYFLYYDKKQALCGYAIATIIDEKEDVGVTVDIELGASVQIRQFYKRIERTIIDLLFYDYWHIDFRIHPANQRIANMLRQQFDYLNDGENDLMKIIEFTPRQQQQQKK
uniref:Uncharacterized protein n=1 Tax=viral metagenome TaxID=1070528 RepID=A0A6C0K3Z7_9ZZZZ